jgi:hypothetical protein
MARTSVTVSDQRASAAFVASATTTYRDAVVEGLLAHNAALQPEDRIDAAVLQQFLTWAGKLLQQRGDALTLAEAAYVAEQADDVPLRLLRDDRFEALSDKVGVVRDRVWMHAGREALSTYGLSRSKPRSVQDLLNYAKTAAALLREQPRMVPDGVSGELSTEVLAESLEGLCEDLAASVQELVTEQRELDAARGARNAAQDELVAMYQMIAGLLVYVFRLAGYPDLAERVRPVIKPATRRSRTPEQGATPPAGTPAGDTPAAAPAQPATPRRRKRRSRRRAVTATAPSRG